MRNLQSIFSTSIMNCYMSSESIYRRCYETCEGRQEEKGKKGKKEIRKVVSKFKVSEKN